MRERLRTRFHGSGGVLALFAPYSVWLLFFYAIPLLAVFVISFWEMRGQDLQPAFTLSNYDAVFTQGEQLPLLLKTVLTSALVVAIVTVIAYPLAYYLVFRMKTPGRVATTMTLVALPFLVGPLVRAVAWKGVLGLQGVINGLLGELGLIDHPIEWLLYSRFSVVVALVYNTYPFMLFALVLSMETVDRNLVAAARDLGSGAWTAFRRIVLPLSAPGFVVGALLTFVPSVSASIEPEILGGPNARFAANAITDKFLVAVDWPAGAALTVCFSTLALIVGAIFVSLALLVVRGLPGREVRSR